ncbi:hypothetical protein DPMN_060745 [Dreissena polymorpha]|uniref:Uncharacterized protein n=1 Tax=Dreissena polymorpha TaxID=45954 RepID=A0A9D4HHT3_DREPO|nr:hypothetical protein DPMN_060745 [Dreissena polymorpha]
MCLILQPFADDINLVSGASSEPKDFTNRRYEIANYTGWRLVRRRKIMVKNIATTVQTLH